MGALEYLGICPQLLCASPTKGRHATAAALLYAGVARSPCGLCRFTFREIGEAISAPNLYPHSAEELDRASRQELCVGMLSLSHNESKDVGSVHLHCACGAYNVY